MKSGQGAEARETCRIRIQSLAAGGDGVGRDEAGRVTFIPYTAAGDLVEARVTEAHARFARAEALDILEPAPERVEPVCPLFSARTCGGCQWQHISAPAQAEAKREIVASALRHLVDAGMELAPVASPVPAYGWRRRARLHWFRPRGSSSALVGFFAPRSRRVTEVAACPQLEPALEAALVTVRGALAAGLHKRGEIELLLGDEGRVHVVLRGPHAKAAARRLAEAPGIAGVRAGKLELGAPAVGLEPGLAGSADRFAQASAEGNRALLEAVARAAAPLEGRRVLELYAGSGNLTRVLARGSAGVVAVDTRPAVGPAAPPIEWRTGPCEEVTRELARAGERFDLAVLDPPREGARAAIEPLSALAPARLVYVSCDPATLARDLELLAARGYRPVRAEPLDLMPQTAHVEVVATLIHSPK